MLFSLEGTAGLQKLDRNRLITLSGCGAGRRYLGRPNRPLQYNQMLEEMHQGIRDFGSANNRYRGVVVPPIGKVGSV